MWEINYGLFFIQIVNDETAHDVPEKQKTQKCQIHFNLKVSRKFCRSCHVNSSIIHKMVLLLRQFNSFVTQTMNCNENQSTLT